MVENWRLECYNAFVNRRGFLKSIAALAALAASPATFASKQDELWTIIEDQTFILDKTYVIDFPNTIIQRCEFVMKSKGAVLELTDRARNCQIINCRFSSSSIDYSACV